MAYVLTIGGVTKTIQPGWSLDASANGRTVFTFRVQSATGSYRPGLDQVVVFTDGGVPIFGGLIERTGEAGWADLGVTPITTTVTAIDYNTFADRRMFNGTIAPGTLKAALQQIVDDYLGPSYGTTLDAAQVTGPSLPNLGYVWTPLKDVLDDLSTQAGGAYVWTITPSNTLLMVEAAITAAPWNLVASPCHAIGDVTVEPTRKDYANQVILYTGTLLSIASDAGEIAAHGTWDAYFTDFTQTAPTTQAALDDLAALFLARSIIGRRIVRYVTETPGLMPGQTQTITLPLRNLSGTFLITAVRRSDRGPALCHYEVSAIEGTIFQPGWRDTWRSVLRGGTGATGAAGVAGATGATGPASAWGTIPGTLSAQTDLSTALAAKEATANKNAASGYAGLDASARIVLTLLQQIATASVLGRNSGGTGDVEVLLTIPAGTLAGRSLADLGTRAVANLSDGSNVALKNAANVFDPNAQTFKANAAGLALKILGRVSANVAGAEFYDNAGATLQGYFQVSDGYFILASAVGYLAIAANSYIEFDAGGAARMTISSAGDVRLHHHVAGTPTFAAGDKYLVVDASGNVHVSAVGPAS